jgi:outer membrane immunogenic protein
MKKLLLASIASIALVALGAGSSALAADMAVRAPIIPPAPVFSWTGFYVGVQIGGAWAHDNASIENPGIPVAIFLPFTVDMDGVIGGGHIGYNWQVGQWVFGVEGSVDAANLKKSFVVGVCPLFCGNATTETDIQGSFRGRIGVAFDRALFYATGGVAIANITNTYDTTQFGGGFASIEDTHVGWTVGGGIAYAVTNNWSVRAEYRYSDFGDFIDKSNIAFFPATNLNRHLTQNQVQGGISYKF